MRTKSDQIRQFIIENIEGHPSDLGSLVSDRFKITRQAFNRHIKTMVEDELIEAKGTTRKRTYKLRVHSSGCSMHLNESLDEDRIWREQIDPITRNLSDNVANICHYGFTEMVNNAIDHSNGHKLLIGVQWSAKSLRIMISDDGVGVFEKIRTAYNLIDLHSAIIELSKGKLTTAPEAHTGQGIFFTSRMFDRFSLFSNGLAFLHRQSDGNKSWLIENGSVHDGTNVSMEIALNTTRTPKAVFDRFSLPESDGFLRTQVALAMIRYNKEELISRSQAKRVLTRLDHFEEVFLDFEGVETIGQAFADEIFRVYRNAHPGVKLIAANTNTEIDRLIRAAESPGSLPSSPPNRAKPGDPAN